MYRSIGSRILNIECTQDKKDGIFHCEGYTSASLHIVKCDNIILRERKKDILMSFKRPKWPIRPNKRLHLNCHLVFENKGLSINMDKTEVMVFNTTQAWVTRSEPEFFSGGEKVEYTCSYTYLGVIFTRPRFSLREVACARLSRGYAALGVLEIQCADLQFHEP